MSVLSLSCFLFSAFFIPLALAENATWTPIENATVPATVTTAAENVTLPPESDAPVCLTNVFSRVRACYRESGVLSAALRSTVTPEANFDFCGPKRNVTLACLQSTLDLCMDNPMRRALLKLHVDLEMTDSDLQYFCENQHVLKEEANCTNYQEASRCTQRAAKTLQNTLIFKLTMKPILDARCVYSDDLVQCLTGAMGAGCNRTRELYTRLLHAIRYPYCDLPELDQYQKLHHAYSFAHQESVQGSSNTRSGGGNGGGGPAVGRGIDFVFYILMLVVVVFET